MNRLAIFIFACTIGVVGCKEKSSPTVAKVGSISLTLDEVQSRLRDTPPAYQHYVGTEEGRKQYL